MLESLRFVSVDDPYVRISPREGTELFQAYIRASGSCVIPATGRDTDLERSGEVARLAGQ
jgi:hypothetical protein